MREDDLELERLSDGAGSPLERALLDAGRSSGSSPSARNRTLAALGLAGSTALAAGAVSAAPVVAAGKAVGVGANLGVAKLLAIVSVVGAAVAIPVGVYVTNRNGRLPDRAAIARGAEAARPRVLPTPAMPEAPPASAVAPAVPERVAPAPVRAHLARAEGRDARRAEARDARRAEAAALAPGGVLADQLAVLDAARGALVDGNPQRALALLDAYARAYPSGQLALEAEVLRIDALAKSGRTALARSRAQAFLRQHPGSVLSARLRAHPID
jgi:hypothetical protein